MFTFNPVAKKHTKKDCSLPFVCWSPNQLKLNQIFSAGLKHELAVGSVYKLKLLTAYRAAICVDEAASFQQCH